MHRGINPLHAIPSSGPYIIPSLILRDCLDALLDLLSFEKMNKTKAAESMTI